MSYVWMAVVGFVVGLMARALLPGNQKLGLVLTSLLGIAGAFLANAVGQWLHWYASGELAGFAASVAGSVVLLWAVGLLRQGGRDGD